MEQKGSRFSQVLYGDIAASELELPLVHLVFEQQSFALHFGGKMAVDRLERVEEQQVTPMESNVFSAHVDAGCPLMDEMELMAADAVGDGTQIALAALTRRIVGYAASENAANVIPLCQLWQAEVAAFCHIILGFYIKILPKYSE